MRDRFARMPGQGAMRKHCKARLGFREAALSRQDVRFVVVETIVLNECVQILLRFILCSDGFSFIS